MASFLSELLLPALPGVEEARGASLSARSLELMLSVREKEWYNVLVRGVVLGLLSFDWSKELSLLCRCPVRRGRERE